MLAWQSSTDTIRSTGIAAVPTLRWGSHFCQFFRSAEDLLEVLVPFFCAGLARNERCVWVTCEPLVSGEARARMRTALPAFDRLEEQGQIEIIDHTSWDLRNGGQSLDAVLDGWRVQEEAAIRDGYDGLRVNGNTYFLERTAYAGFAAYEERVHTAFKGRRILALCSYSLDRLPPGDVLDALKHHGFALLRDGERWNAVRSGSALLAALGQASAHAPASGARPQLAVVKAPTNAPHAHGHDVRFYQGEGFPLDAMVDYLSESLLGGGAAIVIATTLRTPSIRTALAARGLDLAVCEASGALTMLDAERTLAALEDGDELSRVRFDAVVGERVRHVSNKFGKVHASSQLVDLLCQQNRQHEATVLEQWWNGLRNEHNFALLCAYDVDSFVDASTCSHFANICKEHGDVFAVSASVQNQNFDADRLLAHYEQQTRALQHELWRARRLQHEREELVRLERAAAAEAAIAGRYLARLQQITAALSEAATVEAIGHVVSEELAHVVGASSALLALAREGSATLCPFAASGPLLGACEDAHRTGNVLWIAGPESAADAAQLRAVVLPLAVRGRKHGAIGLVFSSARAVGSSERAFIEDLGRQVAVALERAQ